MHYHGRTDTGRERNTNEDAFLILEHPPFYIFGVADGMGGHAAGEVASSLAFKSIKAFLKDNLEGLKEMDPSVDNFSTFIFNMISEANYQIWQASQNSRDHHGMGTTVTLGILTNNHFFIGHVGDSRAYVIHEDSILQVTRDHSLVAEMLENGQLDKEEAQNHPQRHVLTRALGTGPYVEVDFFHGEFHKGDIFIFCTDGLTSTVGMEEILLVGREGAKAGEMAATLVGMANQRGGPDNITVVVVKNISDNKDLAR